MALAAVLTAGGAAGAPLRIVRIGIVGAGGVNAGVGISAVAIADARGAFQREFARDGILVQPVPFAGTGPAINEGLAQHNIAFGEYGGLPVIIGLAGGVNGRLVASHRAETPYYIAVKPTLARTVNNVAKLRGHSIAVKLGTLPHMILVHLLAANGVKPADVRIINLERAEAMAAFNAGAVDAVFGSTSLLPLRDGGQAQLIATTRSLPPMPFDISGLVVDRQFEQANRAIVSRIVKVVVETSAWSARPENRKALLAYYARTGIPPHYLAEQLQGWNRAHFSPLINQSTLLGLRQSTDFALQNRLIRKRPNFVGWAAPEYGRDAIKTLHLADFWSPQSR
jgi:sulfonate transport system substrate-binding protein